MPLAVGMKLGKYKYSFQRFLVMIILAAPLSGVLLLVSQCIELLYPQNQNIIIL